MSWPLRAAALGLALVLAGAGAGAGAGAAGAADGGADPVPAGTLANDEVTVATLDPAGLPVSAQLVSRLVSNGGPVRRVQDPAATTNVTYLDRRGAPRTVPGAQLVQVGGPGQRTVVTEALFDKPLPVALHAQYRLAGRSIDPAAVPGAAGVLEVVYTLTNTSARQQDITATDAAGTTTTTRLPVFVPFGGALRVTVPPDAVVLDAPGGQRSTDAAGRTVLTFPVLLAPPAGDFQTRVPVTLRTARAAVPAVEVSLAPTTRGTDPALLFAGGLLDGSVAAAAEVAAGLTELDQQTGRLAGGAGALADGAAALAGGAAALADGLAPAADGAAQVGAGAAALQAGLGGLAAALEQGLGVLPQAAAGAARLAEGAGVLADAVGSAADGPWRPEVVLPPLPELPPVPDLPPDWDELVQRIAGLAGSITVEPAGPRDGVCDLDTDGDGALDNPVVDSDCVPTLVQGLALLTTGAGWAAQVAAELGPLLVEVQAGVLTAAAGTAEAAAAAGTAAAGADALLGEVCGSPPVLPGDQCALLAEVARDATAAGASAAAAGQRLAQLQPALAQAALRGTALAAGLPLLAGLLQLAADAADQVGAGLRSGDPGDPGLAEGADLLAAGLAEAAAAAGQLAAAGSAAGAGAQALADGAERLAAGVTAASAGAAQLADGAGTLAGGTAALAAGAAQLQRDGTSPALRTAQESSRQPALAQAYLAATDARAADALPYGAPAGATGTARYLFVLPAVEPSAGRPPWAWLAAAAFGATGLAAALLRRRTSAGPI
jgi:putative membrane protein